MKRSETFEQSSRICIMVEGIGSVSQNRIFHLEKLHVTFSQAPITMKLEVVLKIANDMHSETTCIQCDSLAPNWTVHMYWS